MNFDSRGVPTVCSAQATSYYTMPVGKQSVIIAVYPDTMDGTGCSTIFFPRAGWTALAYHPQLQSAAKELGMTCQRIPQLQSAAKELGMTCQRILFEKLDFGETSVLDQFYSADVAVADITEVSYQAVLSYHLGLRENFDMKQNMVTYIDQDTPNLV